MFAQRLLAARLTARSATFRSRVQRFATNTEQNVESQAESQKRVAEGIFENSMWPLIGITVVVGFVGYHYRKLLMDAGPAAPLHDHKSVDQIRDESKDERDFQRKLYREVDSERNKLAERAWSKGALAKSALVSSPEVSEEEKAKAQFPTERQAALTKPGVEPSA